MQIGLKDLVILFSMVSILASLAGIAILYFIFRAAQWLHGRVSVLEKNVEDLKGHEKSLEENVKQLKEQRLTNLPHAARDGLEDGIGTVLDILQSEEAERIYREARMRQLFDLLKKLRANPTTYQEMPNAKVPYEKRHGRKDQA